MSSSACIELIRYRIPEETTMILTFLHLIEKHKLGEQIFETVKTHLKTRGMTIRPGTIVYAALISVPRSTAARAMPECAGGEITNMGT